MRLIIFLLLFVLRDATVVISNTNSLENQSASPKNAHKDVISKANPLKPQSASPTGSQTNCCMMVTVVGNTFSYDPNCDAPCIRGVYMRDVSGLNTLAKHVLTGYLLNIKHIEGPVIISNISATVFQLDFPALVTVNVGHDQFVLRDVLFAPDVLLSLKDTSITALDCNKIVVEKNTNEPKILTAAVKKAKEVCWSKTTTLAPPTTQPSTTVPTCPPPVTCNCPLVSCNAVPNPNAPNNQISSTPQTLQSGTANGKMTNVVVDDNSEKILGLNVSKNWFIALVIISILLLLILIASCVLGGFSGFLFKRCKNIEPKAKWFDILFKSTKLKRLATDPILQKAFENDMSEIQEWELKEAVRRVLEEELRDWHNDELRIVRPDVKPIENRRDLTMAMQEINFPETSHIDPDEKMVLVAMVEAYQQQCNDAWDRYQTACSTMKKVTKETSHAVNMHLRCLFGVEIDTKWGITHIRSIVYLLNKVVGALLPLLPDDGNSAVKIETQKLIDYVLELSSDAPEVQYLLNTPFGSQTSQVHEDVALVEYLADILAIKGALNLECVEILRKVADPTATTHIKKLSYVTCHGPVHNTLYGLNNKSIFGYQGPIDKKNPPAATNEIYETHGTASMLKNGARPQSVSEKFDNASEFPGAESNAGSNAESDAGTKPKSSAGTKPKPDVGPKPVSGTKTEPKSVAGTKTEPKSVAGTKTEPKPVAGTKTEPKSVAGTKTEPKSVAGTKTEPKSVAGTKTEPKSVAGTKTESKPVAGTKTEPKSVAGTKTKPDVEIPPKK